MEAPLPTSEDSPASIIPGEVTFDSISLNAILIRNDIYKGDKVFVIHDPERKNIIFDSELANPKTIDKINGDIKPYIEYPANIMQSIRFENDSRTVVSRVKGLFSKPPPIILQRDLSEELRINGMLIAKFNEQQAETGKKIKTIKYIESNNYFERLEVTFHDDSSVFIFPLMLNEYIKKKDLFTEDGAFRTEQVNKLNLLLANRKITLSVVFKKGSQPGFRQDEGIFRHITTNGEKDFLIKINDTTLSIDSFNVVTIHGPTSEGAGKRKTNKRKRKTRKNKKRKTNKKRK